MADNHHAALGAEQEHKMTGQDLRQLRVRLGLTQTVFARQIGTSKSAIAWIEWQNRPVSRERATAATALEHDATILQLPAKCDQTIRRKVDDALIVEAALLGKNRTAIALEMRCSRHAIRERLRRLDFPQGSEGRQYNPYRFLHGSPLTKQQFEDLRHDFGVTKKVLIEAGLVEGVIQIESIQSLPWRRSEAPVRRKNPLSNYAVVITDLARFTAHDPLNLRLGDFVRDLRGIWTERFCVPSNHDRRNARQVGATCKFPAREFLESEIRGLAAQRRELHSGLTLLRAWLRTCVSGNVCPSDHDILNWICRRCSWEVQRKRRTSKAFHALMFRWLSLKDFLHRNWDLLIQSREIGPLVDKLLAEEYGASEKRIRSASKGEIKALQPATLRKLVEMHYENQRPGSPGRPRVRSELIEDRIRLAAAFHKRGWNQSQMSPFVYVDTPASAYTNTRHLWVRHRTNITDTAKKMSDLDASSLLSAVNAPPDPPKQKKSA